MEGESVAVAARFYGVSHSFVEGKDTGLKRLLRDPEFCVWVAGGCSSSGVVDGPFIRLQGYFTFHCPGHCSGAENWILSRDLLISRHRLGGGWGSGKVVREMSPPLW